MRGIRRFRRTAVCIGEMNLPPHTQIGFAAKCFLLIQGKKSSLLNENYLFYHILDKMASLFYHIIDKNVENRKKYLNFSFI